MVSPERRRPARRAVPSDANEAGEADLDADVGEAADDDGPDASVGEAPDVGDAPDVADEDEVVDGAAVRRVEPEDTGDGDLLVRANNVATVAFAVAAALAAAWPDTFVRGFVPLSLVLFAVGCVAFTWAFAVAVGRSRFEVVDMGGLFFLGGGAAPARVRRAFQLALAAQVVVAVAAAVARPFTPLAFGVLAPTLGVGLMALWGARYAAFPPRDDER
jgi:hypothetical protein